jgi:hypothetical protein
MRAHTPGAGNGYLEVPVYVLKVKQEYTIRKMEEVNGYITY